MNNPKLSIFSVLPHFSHTNIHGLATPLGVMMTLSLIKEGAKIRSGWKHFDVQIADEKSIVRLVGFEPKLWNTLHESCDKSKCVPLMNCMIQTNKRSGEFRRFVLIDHF